MDNPGTRYQRTPWGWEPPGAFPPPRPIPPTGRELLLRLIQDTIDCGVPPKRAVKWWTYIFSVLRERESRMRA